jgi:hypothetical protein
VICKATPSNRICAGKFAKKGPINWPRSWTTDDISLEGDTGYGTSNFANKMVS